MKTSRARPHQEEAREAKHAKFLIVERLFMFAVDDFCYSSLLGCFLLVVGAL
jgi:hypothetical protein